MKTYSYNDSNEFMIEQVNLLDMASTHETPFYIYSKSEIDKNCQDVQDLVKNYKVLPCYALKANYNPTLLKQIVSHGIGVDVVSGGELFFALQAGVNPGKIVFAGVGKTDHEIAMAIDNKIHSINIESYSELLRVAKIAEEKKETVHLAIRVNPDIDPKTHPYISTGLHSNKFGVTRDEALRLYRFAAEHAWLKPEGIHVHIGSQISSQDPYVETAQLIKKFAAELKSMGIHISYFDLGGGIGIDYNNQIDNEDKTYLKTILPSLLQQFKGMDIRLVMELGRSLIGSAGILVTKIIYIKRTPTKKFIIVDAAMNNLIRPSLYQAVHQIAPVKVRDSKTEAADIVGPVCETGDFLARNYPLPEVREGDYLVVTGAGAYGQSLSSNYNLRPRISEYRIANNNIEKIYNGETIEQIARQYKW